MNRGHLINVMVPSLSETDLYEIQVENGQFTAIRVQNGSVKHPEFASIRHLDPTNMSTSPQRWDVEGRIMLPELVDSHMHLDKAFCLPQVPNHSGTLNEAVLNYHAASPFFSLEEMKARMLRAALQALSFGTTAIRTHIDFLPNRSGASVFLGIQAALEVKELLQPYVSLQIAPMCPLGVGPREIDMVEEAFRMGADLLGGAPHLSPTADQDLRHIFALAAKYDRDIDLHTDENDDPAVNTLATIIAKTEEYGYQGRVVVDHLCSLAGMEDEHAAELIDGIVKNQIGVITLPASNFYLQGRGDRGIVRRGLTRVKELLAAGAAVATASDNVHDPFHPFGRGDLLQVGLLTAYGAHLGSPAEQWMILRMITDIPAKLLGMKKHGIAAGETAAFVLVNACRTEEILTLLPEERWVFKGGSWLHAVKRQTLWGKPALEHLWKQALPPGVNGQE
ncbi:amidohydrolase family protein [Brevibacillus sp. B_LB10_24]|uniref:amidohydrolase family protein n=1 Tax=Brevibacillus sp. B_LB10_24 TaxID=3380645 RepID=UPI0038B9F9A6